MTIHQCHRWEPRLTSTSNVEWPVLEDHGSPSALPLVCGHVRDGFPTACNAC